MTSIPDVCILVDQFFTRKCLNEDRSTTFCRAGFDVVELRRSSVDVEFTERCGFCKDLGGFDGRVPEAIRANLGFRGSGSVLSV